VDSHTAGVRVEVRIQSCCDRVSPDGRMSEPPAALCTLAADDMWAAMMDARSAVTGTGREPWPEKNTLETRPPNTT